VKRMEAAQILEGHQSQEAAVEGSLEGGNSEVHHSPPDLEEVVQASLLVLEAEARIGDQDEAAEEFHYFDKVDRILGGRPSRTWVLVEGYGH